MALLWCLPACASRPPAHTEAEVASVFESFYGAVTRGDASAAMSVIAPDAVFIESGTLETRAEYEKNHLPSDIEFERQMTEMLFELTKAGCCGLDECSDVLDERIQAAHHDPPVRPVLTTPAQACASF